MHVSVLMITYNQREFIAQAIESVLMQRTTFDFELVIGEDGSSDGTREIVMDFQKRHPNQVRALLRQENLGMMENFIQTCQSCRADYIALLEGDDYWTSPDKLQIQADYLDTHPDCAICFHATTIQHQHDERLSHVYFPPGRRSTYTLEELLAYDLMHTNSVMYRYGLFDRFPDWFRTLPMADWPLHILNAEHGKIGYVDQIMAAYRVHPQGVWSRLTRIERLHQEIETYEVINRHLKLRYDRTIKSLVGRRYYRLAVEHGKRGELRLARNYTCKSIATCPLNRQISRMEMAGLLLFLYAPPVYRLARALRSTAPSGLRA